MFEETIQKISDLAADYATKYISDCHRYNYYIEHNEYEIRYREKFAELIIRECCQKLENDGMVEVAMELKEHFGVE